MVLVLLEQFMKGIVKNIVINAGSLYALSQLLAGVKVLGGIQTFLLAGIVFYLISFTIKPILQILTLPFNLATLGMFFIITNAILLYLLTVLVPQIIVSAFIFPGASVAGFVIPKIYFSTLFAYIISAFILSTITSIIQWFIK